MRYSLVLIVSLLLFSSIALADKPLLKDGDIVTISPVERNVTLIEDHANLLVQYKDFKVIVRFSERSKAESMTDVKTGKRVTFCPESEAKGKGKAKKTQSNY